MEIFRGESASRNIVIAFVTVPLVLISLVLVVVFRQVPGDLSGLKLDFSNITGSEQISRKTMDALIAKTTVALKQKAAVTYSLADSTIRFNSLTDSDIIPTNKAVLAISAKYFNSTVIKSVNKDFVDPLIPLAQSEVEWCGWGNSDILYSVAIPAAFVPVTVDSIKTFGIAQAMNYPKLFENHHYIGPLQQEPAYGVVEAANPDDLKTNEYGLVVKALGGEMNTTDGNMLGYWSDVKAYDANGRITGDRFNWVDACNRFAGKVQANFAGYRGDAELPNKYAFIALETMGSDTGEDVINGKNSDVPGCWVSSKDARDYANDLGSDAIVKIIFDRAKLAVDNHWTLKTKLSFRVENEVARSWITDWRNAGYIKKNYWAYESSEQICYPVQALYAYAQLYYLYHGE